MTWGVGKQHKARQVPLQWEEDRTMITQILAKWGGNSEQQLSGVLAEAPRCAKTPSPCMRPCLVLVVGQIMC